MNEKIDLNTMNIENEYIEQLGLVINDMLTELEFPIRKFERRDPHSAEELAYEIARVHSRLTALNNMIVDKSRIIEQELEVVESELMRN